MNARCTGVHVFNFGEFYLIDKVRKIAYNLYITKDRMPYEII